MLTCAFEHVDFAWVYCRSRKLSRNPKVFSLNVNGLRLSLTPMGKCYEVVCFKQAVEIYAWVNGGAALFIQVFFPVNPFPCLDSWCVSAETCSN